MATKNFGITISEWVFEAYLQGVDNRSKYIEECIIKAADLSSGEFENTKSRNLLLAKKNKTLYAENTKLTRHINLYKEKFEKRDPAKYDKELIEKQKMADSIIKSGIMGDDADDI